MIMRILFVLIFIVLSTMTSVAQQLAMNLTPAKEEKAPAAVAEAKAEKQFIFNVYGDLPVMEPVFEEEHFLGNPVTGKWNTFNTTYTHVYEVSVGLSGSGVEIRKPAIYNAVQKVNKHLKKELKSKKINKDEAMRLMSHILDCANVISMEPDTEKFESAASEAKTPEQIIALFNTVELKFI